MILSPHPLLLRVARIAAKLENRPDQAKEPLRFVMGVHASRVMAHIRAGDKLEAEAALLAAEQRGLKLPYSYYALLSM